MGLAAILINGYIDLNQFTLMDVPGEIWLKSVQQQQREWHLKLLMMDGN